MFFAVVCRAKNIFHALHKVWTEHKKRQDVNSVSLEAITKNWRRFAVSITYKNRKWFFVAFCIYIFWMTVVDIGVKCLVRGEVENEFSCITWEWVVIGWLFYNTKIYLNLIFDFIFCIVIFSISICKVRKSQTKKVKF